MTIFAALNDQIVTSGTVEFPAWGMWHADLVLAESDPVAGTLTLTLGDISATCTAVRNIDYAGSRGVRVVGGFGGWRRVVGPRQYAQPTGLNLSLVLQDAAASVGEVLGVVVDRIIGTAYIRSQMPASRILNQLAPDGWYIGTDGKTNVSPRPAGAVSTPFTAMGVQRAGGIYTIATDKPGDWVPGRTFAGPQVTATIGRVTHKLTAGALRSEVVAVG